MLDQWKAEANRLGSAAHKALKQHSPDIRMGTRAAPDAIGALRAVLGRLVTHVRFAERSFPDAIRADGETIQLIKILTQHGVDCIRILPPEPKKRRIGFQMPGARRESEALDEAMDRLDGVGEQEWSWDGLKNKARDGAAALGIMHQLVSPPPPKSDMGSPPPPLTKVVKGVITGVESLSPTARDRRNKGVKPPASGQQPDGGPPPGEGRRAIAMTGLRDGWVAPTSRWALGQAEGEGETGWDMAARRLQGSSPPHSAGAATRSSPADAASAARKRIRPAVAPAFAAALDTAVNPDLILGFVRKRGGAPDLAALRQAYVATAARHFAVEFVRTIGSAPKGTSENLALGAIIASALAQTGQQFPIVPPPAVPAMSVLIHKTLQPQLPALARMAAVIAAAPAAQPMREMAW